MSDARRAHAEACAKAANALAAVPATHRPDVFVGLDGFIDHIIDVVDKRTSPSAYSRIQTIAALGAKISAAAGQSAGFGAVKTVTKLGGNGPIMANALCAQDLSVTFVGVLGDPIETVFQPLASRAKQTISLGPPAVTDALEFDDGKIMLNFAAPLLDITFDHVAARCGGLDGLKAMFKRSVGIATVNWSQIPGMTALWRRLAKDVLPGLRPDRPLWFVDLSDPNRHTAESIRDGMAALGEIQRHADVVLGLNGNETRQLCGAYDLPYPEKQPEWEGAREACSALRQKLGLSRVMCHLVKSSAVAWDGGSAALEGFFDPKPKLTTGAGDHYNAGFFAAMLAGIGPEQCLQIGGATSGHYVRTAESPTRAQVVGFLRQHASAASSSQA